MAYSKVVGPTASLSARNEDIPASEILERLAEIIEKVYVKLYEINKMI